MIASNTMEIHQLMLVGTHVQIERRTYMINVCMQWLVFFHMFFWMNLAQLKHFPFNALIFRTIPDFATEVPYP